MRLIACYREVGGCFDGRWDDLDRHSAIERWVLAEMEITGVDPLSVGRPLPDHLQHPSQRPSKHPPTSR